MLFLSPNQQCQSIEGNSCSISNLVFNPFPGQHALGPSSGIPAFDSHMIVTHSIIVFHQQLPDTSSMAPYTDTRLHCSAKSAQACGQLTPGCDAAVIRPEVGRVTSWPFDRESKVETAPRHAALLGHWKKLEIFKNPEIDCGEGDYCILYDTVL